jgi:hypothetical protein
MTTTFCFRLISFFALATLSLTLTSCGATAQDDASRPQEPDPAQYLILLDLSDRILTAGQADRDKQILTFLKDKFIRGCKQKTIFLSEDQFTIRIPYQKDNPLGADESMFEDSLSLNLNALDETQRRAALDAFDTRFSKTLNKLYDKAGAYPSEKMYQGADLWGYFRDELNQDLKSGMTTQLYILTDGYLDFEKPENRKQNSNRFTDSGFLQGFRNTQWEKEWNQKDQGILPIKLEQSTQLTLHLLEFNPKKEWQDEYPLLCSMWSKWMKESNISLIDQPTRNDRPMSGLLNGL